MDRSFEALHGERVIVRRFRDEDATTFAAYRSDPDVARFQSWDAPYSAAVATAFVAALHDCDTDSPGEWFQYAVEEVATGRHVGDLASHTDAEVPGLVTVGVTFAREAQGRGLATEAMALLLEHLFTTRGVHRVIADCDTRNIAVAALLERIGMRREAHHVASWPEPDGSWSDEYVYAVLAEEWHTRRGASPRPGGGP